MGAVCGTASAQQPGLQPNNHPIQPLKEVQVEPPPSGQGDVQLSNVVGTSITPKEKPATPASPEVRPEAPPKQVAEPEIGPEKPNNAPANIEKLESEPEDKPNLGKAGLQPSQPKIAAKPPVDDFAEIEEQPPQQSLKPFHDHEISRASSGLGLGFGDDSGAMGGADEDFGQEESIIPGNPEDSNQFLFALFGASSKKKGRGGRLARRGSAEQQEEQFISWAAFGKGMPAQKKGKKGKGCSVESEEEPMAAAHAETSSREDTPLNLERKESSSGLIGSQKLNSSMNTAAADNTLEDFGIAAAARPSGNSDARLKELQSSMDVATEEHPDHSANQPSSSAEITFESIANGPPPAASGPPAAAPRPLLGGLIGVGNIGGAHGRFGLDDEDEETEDVEPPRIDTNTAPPVAIKDTAPEPEPEPEPVPKRVSKPKPTSDFEIEEVVEEAAGKMEAGVDLDAAGYPDQISELEEQMARHICSEVDAACACFRKFLQGEAGSDAEMNSHLNTILHSVDLEAAARDTLMRVEVMSKLIGMVKDNCLEYQQGLRTIARLLREVVLTFFQTMRGTHTDYLVAVWELFSLFDSETEALLSDDPDQVDKTKEILQSKLPGLVKEVAHWDGCRLRWPATGKWAYGLNLME